jgi:hypothetical protein
MSNAVWCCGALYVRSITNLCILPNNFFPASLHGRASAFAISLVMLAEKKIDVVSHREHGGHRGFRGCVVVDLCEMRLVLHNASRISPQRHCMGARAPVQSFTGSDIFDRCEMRFVSRGGTEPRRPQPRALDGKGNRHGMTLGALFKTRFAFSQKAC